MSNQDSEPIEIILGLLYHPYSNRIWFHRKSQIIGEWEQSSTSPNPTG